jgi:hypothetical protein
MSVQCVRTLAFGVEDNATSAYIDLAQSLSFVNRRLYPQGKCYYIQKIQWISGNALVGGATSSKCTLSTLPYNWVTRNAWVKSKALWNSMQMRVLKDNPSIAGKWRDYKVFMDLAHNQGGTGASGPTLNLKPIDAAGAVVGDGEWNMSTLVLPQHDVDPATGVVLAADEFEVHMMGLDNGGPLPAALVSGSIIKMYQDTRARQNQAPLVPGDMSESWGTQLTDSGSQDPELADLIDAENDLPPYDNDAYPGGGANFDGTVLQTTMVTTVSNQVDKDIGFPVPLGLIKVNRQLVDNTNPGILLLTLAEGTTAGVHTTEVKQ